METDEGKTTPEAPDKACLSQRRLEDKTQPMAKRKTRKYNRRSIDEQISHLEARLAELRGVAKSREKFSAELVKTDRARLELTAKDYAELVGVSMITIYS